jgi:hypothetical protein
MSDIPEIEVVRKAMQELDARETTIINPLPGYMLPSAAEIERDIARWLLRYADAYPGKGSRHTTRAAAMIATGQWREVSQ